MFILKIKKKNVFILIEIRIIKIGNKCIFKKIILEIVYRKKKEFILLILIYICVFYLDWFILFF